MDSLDPSQVPTPEAIAPPVVEPVVTEVPTAQEQNTPEAPVVDPPAGRFLPEPQTAPAVSDTAVHAAVQEASVNSDRADAALLAHVASVNSAGTSVLTSQSTYVRLERSDGAIAVEQKLGGS